VILVIEEDIKAVEKSLAKEQEKKKVVVVYNIVAHCNEVSSFADLRTIGAALNAGDNLVTKTISGGKTNFSSKIYLEGSPDKASFA
jgi:hypothetical protein